MPLKKGIFVHPSSFVDRGAVIGAGTMIWHFSHVFKGAMIGQKCKIGQNVVIHATVTVGDNVKIQNNVSLYDGVKLEDDVFCGPSCVFTNIINPRAAVPRNSSTFYKETLVKKGATIGANATILCGITVGRYAFIGAGAIVTKDVKNYELVFGTPATRKGWMCECGERLLFKNTRAICKFCHKKYEVKKGNVSRNED